MTGTKALLIDEIIRLQGKDANPEWLMTRTLQQLFDIQQRWVAISGLTQKEIDTHCNTDFINKKNS